MSESPCSGQRCWRHSREHSDASCFLLELREVDIQDMMKQMEALQALYEPAEAILSQAEAKKYDARA